jgi:hypothetical protein
MSRASALGRGRPFLIDRESFKLALKRLAVAPAEGLLTEAVLKHGRSCRTAALDPLPTFRTWLPSAPHCPEEESRRMKREKTVSYRSESRTFPPAGRAGSTRFSARPSAIGPNCPSTAMVKRNRSSRAALVSRTTQWALQSRLTTSSALELTICHSFLTHSQKPDWRPKPTKPFFWHPTKPSAHRHRLIANAGLTVKCVWEEIEEERRLLYVAMTRAKDDLHLVVPQRFFTHGQNAQGDHHVYASRTRFIPDELLGLFEGTVWASIPAGSTPGDPSQGVRIDVAARMRGMWR